MNTPFDTSLADDSPAIEMQAGKLLPAILSGLDNHA
jgi:hypothetical protein